MEHKYPWFFLGYLIGSLVQPPPRPMWFVTGALAMVCCDLMLMTRCKDEDGEF